MIEWARTFPLYPATEHSGLICYSSWHYLSWLIHLFNNGAGSQQVLRRVDILFNSASQPLFSSPWGRIHPPSRLRPSLEHLHLCLLGVPISVTIPLTGFSPLCLCPCASHHLEYERNMAGPCMCFLVVQTVKTLPVMWETQVRSLDQKDPLEKGMATHSSILSWRILWLEEPGGLQSMGSQRVRQNWGINNFTLKHVLQMGRDAVYCYSPD